MIPIVRGLRMASDAVGRSPIEYLCFGVLDFIFLLMAAESLNVPVPNYRRAVEWAVGGIASILIGYYWPKIKQRLTRRNDGATVKSGPPITLKQLFEIDWPNLPAFYHEC